MTDCAESPGSRSRFECSQDSLTTSEMEVASPAEAERTDMCVMDTPQLFLFWGSLQTGSCRTVNAIGPVGEEAG